MDSKALLAIVLSFMLFLLWHFYFGPVQPPQPEKKEVPQGSTTAPKAAPSPLPQALLPQAPPPKAALSALKTWTFGDSLFKMQTVEQGARESSFTLNDFREKVEPDSPPVQMISTRDSLHLPLAVDLVHHQDWQLSTRPYSSDAPPEVKVRAGEEPRNVAFSTEVPGKVRLTKVFTLTPDSYVVDMEILIQNLAEDKLVDQVGISFYYKPYPDESSYNASQLTFSNKGSLTSVPAKDLKPEAIPKPPYDWVGYENNYFIQAVIPQSESAYQIVPRVLDMESGLIQTVYLSEPLELAKDETKSLKIRLYTGPKEIDNLGKAGHNLSDAVDYGWFSILAKPLLVMLKWFYGLTHNYGIAIILLTIIIKIVFWPLTQKSYTSMQKMKKVQPKIAQIREKYKNDREKLNQELMMVYKTHKVNPMGGCLPMALQIPVFFALYRMLNAAVDLRHQPFTLWMNDLTAPDRLHVGNFSVNIPFLGPLDGIPVLTILMGVTMFIQQKMTPSTGDPRQEKIMLIMPVMFTFMFINFPAGLVLYWFVNNILSIAQQYWINRNAA
ncbi:MAG: membrane protein insertase YidC [Syntrophobacteraceae bacterium]